MYSDIVIPSGIFGQFSYHQHLAISTTKKVSRNPVLSIPMPAIHGESIVGTCDGRFTQESMSTHLK